MAEVLLNGRAPRDWELPALERARDCEHDRDCEVLAGVLASGPLPVHEGRPVMDLLLEFS